MRNKYDVDEQLETPFNFEHLKRSFVYVKKYRGKMAVSLMLSICGAIIGLTGPLITQRALDVTIPDKNIRELIMLAGLLPMFQSEPPQSLVVYLIPFYNAIEVMTAVFAHALDWTTVAVTLGANIVYTAIAVWGLTRMFNSEKIMFSR